MSHSNTGDRPRPVPLTIPGLPPANPTYSQATVLGIAATRAGRYDDAQLAACTSALAASACADRFPPAVVTCQDALSPRTPRAPGGTCSTRDVPGAPHCSGPAENFCNADSDGCGVCAARKPNGEPCTGNDQCHTGFCDTYVAQKCADPPAGKPAGEGCLFVSFYRV